MKRELFDWQQRMINEFKLRKYHNGDHILEPPKISGHFCGACHEEIMVNEDARPSQMPTHCEACERLIKEGLMALATGRLYETLHAGKRCFKEGDGEATTVADIMTVGGLIADDPSMVAIGTIRENCMIRLVIMEK